MPQPANLVHETSTSTGTGNLTLSSENGKQTFSGAFSTGGTDVFDYFISNRSAAEWERGTGHMSDATTLVRDTVLESTNGGSAVDFTAGTKDVTNDVPAGKQVTTEGEVAFTSYLDFEERTDPSNPSADTMRAYARDDGAGNTEMVLLDSVGREHIVGPPSGQLVAIIEDQKSSGTDGGSFNNGADRTRDLNTLVYNRDSIVGLSSNQFTLPPGDWEIAWSAPGERVNSHQTILRDVTGSTDVKRGSSEFTGSGGTHITRSFGRARVSIGASNTYEIRHRSSGSQSTTGFGAATGFGTEVYTCVEIRRG